MSGEQTALRAEAALASYLAEYARNLREDERRTLEAAKEIMHRKSDSWGR